MTKIVLATDCSAHADAAVDYLLGMPLQPTVDLTLFTVIYVPAAGKGTAYDSWLPEFTQEQHRAAEEHFLAIEDRFAETPITVRHQIASGHVGHSITDLAESLDADLVVLGARGHSAVSRILLGSVSDFVATQANCSVLVVRPPATPSVQPYRTVIAYDSTKESDTAIAQFKRFSWGESVDGQLLSVVPIERTFRRELVPASAAERVTERELAMSAAAEAVDSLRAVAPRFRTHVIESEHTGEAICRFAEIQSAGLIVLGEHERGALDRLILGSTSRYVLRHADCSVWIARDRPTRSGDGDSE